PLQAAHSQRMPWFHPEDELHSDIHFQIQHVSTLDQPLRVELEPGVNWQDDPAQDQPADDQSSQDQPVQEEPAPAPKVERVANPVAEFTGVDKITGRIITFDVYIDETVQFGALQVTPRVCYSRPGAEEPKTDSFVEVDEITLDRKIRRIFSGWMFAQSPGLNAV